MALQRQVRAGLTLVEFLVLIAILGVLVSLVVPAIQKARASAARTQCMHNLRQIGIALHAYNAAHKSFPQGVTCTYSQQGFWLQRTDTPDPSWGWLVWLLPYLEEGALSEPLAAQSRTMATVLESPNDRLLLQQTRKLFLCPSDSDHDTLNKNRLFTNYSNLALGKSNYVGGFGHTPSDGIFNDNVSGGEYQVDHGPVTIEMVTDGLSNTIAAGERRSGGGGRAGLWAGTSRAEKSVFEAVSGCTMFKMQTGEWQSPPLDSHPDWGYNSYHQGGANFLLADGSVRFIQENIDWTFPFSYGTIGVYNRLGKKDDGLPVSGDY